MPSTGVVVLAAGDVARVATRSRRRAGAALLADIVALIWLITINVCVPVFFEATALLANRTQPTLINKERK